MCDGRIWVGNADGSNLASVTANGQHYVNLHWSPDGRWLLTAWQPQPGRPLNALVVLPTDGAERYFLGYTPPVQVQPSGWSPDGRQAIYSIGTEYWAVEVETSEMQPLPGRPYWSPNGEHLVYVTGGYVPSTWLADADWRNPRRIDRGTSWWGEQVWAPDGSKLAWRAPDGYKRAWRTPIDYRFEEAVVIFDLAADRLVQRVAAADLTEALPSSRGDYVTDGSDPAGFTERPLQRLVPWGWSADGSYVLVSGERADGQPNYNVAGLLAATPLDGSTPRVIAFGQSSSAGSAHWSPVNPDRLIFTWLTGGRQSNSPNGHLFDLNAGPIYTATHAWDAAWSPDGAWVAFAGQDQVTIVDQEGQERFTLEGEGACSAVAWNPAADLSGLGEIE
jgi:Tol biopolymer transport system component